MFMPAPHQHFPTGAQSLPGQNKAHCLRWRQQPPDEPLVQSWSRAGPLQTKQHSPAGQSAVPTTVTAEGHWPHWPGLAVRQNAIFFNRPGRHIFIISFLLRKTWNISYRLLAVPSYIYLQMRYNIIVMWNAPDRTVSVQSTVVSVSSVFLLWTLTAVSLCQLGCNNPEWGYQTQTGPDSASFSQHFLNK